jgi:serine/threonine-protein kinase
MDNDPASIEQALANCQKALEIDPRLPAVHVTLGNLHAKLGKNDLALQEFQKVLEINPRDADALIGMAGVSEHAGDVAGAEASYKRAIALRPDYWDGYRVLAEFYDRQKRVQDSIGQYRRIIELTPDNPEAYSDLGVQYMALGDSRSLSAAEAALQKSLQLVPNYQAYANLGWLYMEQKRYSEAAAMTRKALALNDKDWRVWANLQLAYTWLNDNKEMRLARAKVLSILEQYVLVNSRDAQAQSMLGMLYAEDKLREKALVHADAAHTLAPNDPSILANMAETYDDLGDRRQAIHYAQQSLGSGYTLIDLEQRPALHDLLKDANFGPRKKQ